MSGLIRTEGAVDAPNRLIVVEPPDRRATFVVEPMRVDFLDRRAFLEDPRRAFTKLPSQTHVNVVIEGDELELPHDDPAALRDFVESVWLLHGWGAVGQVGADLERMAQIAGVARPAPVAAEPPLLALRAPGPAEQMRQQLRASARRRMGGAAPDVVASWRDAFEREEQALRERLLAVLKAVEQQAAVVTAKRMLDSRKRVLNEVARYFQYTAPATTATVLRQGYNLPVVRDKPAVVGLRARLRALAPGARQAIAAHQALSDYDRDVISTRLPDDDERRQLEEADLSARARHAADVATAGAEFPVLLRMKPPLVLEAGRANDDDDALGKILLEILRTTFAAADEVERRLRPRRPAAGTSVAMVQSGAPTELVIGTAAKDSVWLHPRLIESAIAFLPELERDVAAVAAQNVREASGATAQEEALRLIGNVTMIGLTIALTAVCPPAGIALDIGLSATDIWEESEKYNARAAEAVCDLDPRECLSEPPSAFGVVMAVAGAAMVVV